MSKLFRKEGQKFLVSVTIKSVTLKKPGNTIDKDAQISVAIDRGNKHVSTHERKPNFNELGDAVIQFNHEILKLVSTLYPTDTHSLPSVSLSFASVNFDEKNAKVVIRKKKKNMFGGIDFQILGTLYLPLHELVKLIDAGEDDVDLPFSKTSVLEQCSSYPGSTIEYEFNIEVLDSEHPSSHHSIVPRPSHTSSSVSLSTSTSPYNQPGKSRMERDSSNNSIQSSTDTAEKVNNLFAFFSFLPLMPFLFALFLPLLFSFSITSLLVSQQMIQIRKKKNLRNIHLNQILFRILTHPLMNIIYRLLSLFPLQWKVEKKEKKIFFIQWLI
jgi:hypothetical protein